MQPIPGNLKFMSLSRTVAWADTYQIINYSSHVMVITRIRIVNGTGLTTDSSKVVVTTPNTEYTLTLGNLTSGGYIALDAIGEDVLGTGDTLLVTPTAGTAGSPAPNTFTIEIDYWGI